jgi:hypothetical protein
MDKPIPFKSSMVRAILEGRKTQTRRIITKQAALDAISVFGPKFLLLPGNADLARYAVGDRLWIREAWRTPANWDNRSPSQLVASCVDAGYPRPWCPIAWEADGTRTEWGDWREHEPGRLRASMHLPRAYSRLTLLVTDVRVQRLQEIEDDDAQAEGIYEFRRIGDAPGHASWGYEGCEWRSQTPRGAFVDLWTASPHPAPRGSMIPGWSSSAST